MLEVHRRGGFSDRNNIKSENTEIQLYGFDDRTKNFMLSLISYVSKTIYGYFNSYSVGSHKQQFCKYVLINIYAQRIDYTKANSFEGVFDIIEETIDYDSYDSVLTVLEAIAQFWNENYRNIIGQKLGVTIFELFNNLFEREYVGYRFVKDKITTITDKNEIESINEAICSRYKAVNEHLEKSLEKLSDRNNPDYENSIKESICAVEAICEIITGSKGGQATLGNMLKKLEESGVKIHGALKEAFNKLYGYTSDSKGIRHAGDIGGPNATFEEAKFMLVSCCAFINYLKAIQSKIK